MIRAWTLTTGKPPIFNRSTCTESVKAGASPFKLHLRMVRPWTV
jgi:hypothetical protein